MDPISLAITAALANLSQEVIKDAYNALKTALQSKFGVDSEIVEAVDKLEEKPDSKARQAVLKEEIDTVNAQDDPELVQTAEALLAKIKANPGGQTIISQVVSGNRNIFSGTGNVTLTDRPKD